MASNRHGQDTDSCVVGCLRNYRLFIVAGAKGPQLLWEAGPEGGRAPGPEPRTTGITEASYLAMQDEPALPFSRALSQGVVHGADGAEPVGARGAPLGSTSRS